MVIPNVECENTDCPHHDGDIRCTAASIELDVYGECMTQNQDGD